MHDPDLAVLVPSSTRLRTATLLLAAVLVLVLAGFSPRVLRPTLWGTSSGAGFTVGAADHTFVAVYDITPQVWPSATVTGIVAPRGTHVIGAWLMDANDAQTELGAMSSSALTPVQPETWHAAIESLFMFPVARIGPGTALPQTVHGGKKLVLAAVWQIDDCAAVTAGYSSSPITITDTSNGTPFIRWRTVLGTPWTSDADINRGPTSATAIETFRAAGVCP